MSQQFNVAVLGASGAVGQAMIEILEERGFPVATLYPLASSRSAGDTVRFGGKNIEIKDVEEFDWSQVQIALFSAGAEVSAKWAPIAAEQGCIVIDNTSCFRYDEDIPLVIPEVNPDAIDGYKNKNIIANPNCSTAQLVVALKPLHDAATIKRVVVATYQSVSGAGKARSCAAAARGSKVRRPGNIRRGMVQGSSARVRLVPGPGLTCQWRPVAIGVQSDTGPPGQVTLISARVAGPSPKCSGRALPETWPPPTVSSRVCTRPSGRRSSIKAPMARRT